MKQLILFIIIFAIGAISYPFLNSLLSSMTGTKTTQEKIVPIVSPVVEKTSATKTEPLPAVEKKKPVVIDKQGALHDGPFPVLDVNGKSTSATAEIIRSPEETVLQFHGVHFMHSSGAEIYISTDTKATKHMSLGKAGLNAGGYVYGMPVDIDLSVYKYILIYNPDTNVTEFSVAL